MKDFNSKQNHLSGGVPTIKIQKDVNRNEKKLNKLSLDISFSGVVPSTIRNIQVFSSFEYNLSKKLQIEMTSLMHVNIDTPNGMSRVLIDGFLRFE